MESSSGSYCMMVKVILRVDISASNVHPYVAGHPPPRDTIVGFSESLTTLSDTSLHLG